MTIKDVRKVIEKALKDKQFKTQLIDRPEKALAQFDLTKEERQRLSQIKPDKLAVYKNNLELRYAKDGSGEANMDDQWWVDSVTD